MASMHAASAPVRAVRTPAGDPAWLVSGYDEVRALIADSRLSWTTSAAGASRCSQAAMMGHPDAPGQDSGAGMSFAKVLARSFAPRRIQQLRPRVQQLCDDLLDELAAQTPPVDFHKAVSFPLPAMVICEVLGVPPQDRTEYARQTSIVQAQYNAEVDKAQAEAAASHNRVALDQQLIDQLPQIVQQAARGLSGANVTVLNGTNGLGDLTAGLVSQGLRIFDSVRQNLGNDAPGTAPAVRQEGDR